MVATLERGWAVIQVIDDGPGIQGISPTRVFDRFAHGTSSANDTRTTHGIGLALVHDVVSRYGGTVKVERTGSEGTTFQLRLPTATTGHRLGSSRG